VQSLDLELSVLSVVAFALLAVKLWALVDAILRPPAAYLAADKQTKTAWLWILGLAFVAQCIPALALPYGFLSLIGTVAAFVYLLDVRPALSAVTRRR
jgi:hypothetical protein